MNILVLNYEFPPLGGGSSPVCYEIAKGYRKLGHEVDVVTMGFKGRKSREMVERVNVYRVKCFRKKGEICRTHEMLSYIVSAAVFLKSFMKVKQYDICHCHFIVPTGILALLLKKKLNLDYILTAHGSDVPGYNPDRFAFQHKFTKPLLNTICKNARQICSPSLFLKDLITETIGMFNIRHIPNGIDLNCFRPDLNRPKENIKTSN